MTKILFRKLKHQLAVILKPKIYKWIQIMLKGKDIIEFHKFSMLLH